MGPYQSRIRGFVALLLFIVPFSFTGSVTGASPFYLWRAAPPISVQTTNAVIYLPLVTQPAARVDTIAIDGATMTFYRVTGRTANDLRGSLNQNRPGSYDALTEWYFQWTGCRPEGVGVEYSITVTFPEWEVPENPSSGLVPRWNQYINALAFHEKGHVDLVLAAVPGFTETLQTVPCDQINSTAQSLLAEINDQNEQYDADTGHGATQGAVFP